MPLAPTSLKTEIQIFSDQLFPLFEGFPNNLAENAEKWADAVDTYARIVVPYSTTNEKAKQTFINIMKGLSEPLSQSTNNTPFTLGYRSPERNLNDFNTYLKKIGYTSNPKLDKQENFFILENIRTSYNKLYPSRELTTDEIKYNQSRFNEIYASEIKAGKVEPLQVDGIIGDDTIKYFPVSSSFIYEKKNDAKWNKVYSTIKFVTQPRLTGEVDCSEVSNRNIKKQNPKNDYRVYPISTFQFTQQFIDKGLSKDYRVILLDTTQQQRDGFQFTGTFPSFFLKSIGDYKQVFESTHTLHNPFWKTNKISSINQLVTFYKLKEKTYKALPEAKKDGLVTLQNATIGYAQELALGMQPAFTGAPPTGPLVLKPVAAAGLAGSACSECIDIMVTIIDTWFRLGTATNNSSGVIVPWV